MEQDHHASMDDARLRPCICHGMAVGDIGTMSVAGCFASAATTLSSTLFTRPRIYAIGIHLHNQEHHRGLRRALPFLLGVGQSFACIRESRPASSGDSWADELNEARRRPQKRRVGLLCRRLPLLHGLPHHPLQLGDRLLPPLVDLVVYHQPAPAQLEPFLLPQLHEPLLVHARPLEVQPAHVGLHGVRHPAAQLPDPQPLDLPRQLVRAPQQPALPAGALPKRLVDGDPRRRRQRARLPQPAADALAHPPRVPDHVPRPDDDAARRRAEPLAEAQRQRVEARPELGQAAGARGHGLPEARAVAVRAHAVRARPGRDAARLGEGHDRPRERVLEADHARRARVHVVVEVRRRLHVLEREVDAVGRDDGREHGAAEGGDAVGDRLVSGSRDAKRR
ncbi:uncharacterized protein E0L32_003635 [Thyridium curvatum]|uniref:Uncharacterized protein n=1 Tax=Thyridium curvatum TaxID=1093900 RepID=A0A507BDD8_9PEZI|nr:uncharacterized protein E0L32_003635 [Thyridium curvatum]TPX16694.1 hypothetical protein E0L32_003635 [Thyridium curvatum]